MTRRDVILYPIFIEASQYANDEYWAMVFTELAYGNAPYGCYIDKDQLQVCSRIGTKAVSVSFYNCNDADQIYKKFFHFFHTTLGNHSQKDFILSKEKLRNQYCVSYDEWGDIKRKNSKGVRELLLSNFVLDIKKKFRWSIHQAKTLHQCLSLWFQFKTLDKVDVKFDGKNCRITGIRGLSVNSDGTFKLDRNFI